VNLSTGTAMADVETPARAASEVVTRRAGGSVDRRGSLLTLGGAAVTAALAEPTVVQAGKIARNARKRSKKKCKRQVDACRSSLTTLCSGDPECEPNFLPCCSDLSDCKAGRSLDCFFANVS
jgi:hypothetical protein